MSKPQHIASPRKMLHNAPGSIPSTHPPVSRDGEIVQPKTLVRVAICHDKNQCGVPRARSIWVSIQGNSAALPYQDDRGLSRTRAKMRRTDWTDQAGGWPGSIHLGNCASRARTPGDPIPTTPGRFLPRHSVSPHARVGPYHRISNLCRV